MMLGILLFIPRDYAGPCFIGFAIGESLGASALRIAGGIFTKIADIGSDLMKIVFNIKEDDARNPGVIADCTGDNAGDSVGPIGRRLRDLRRHRRRAHHLHPARASHDPTRPGPAARLDLRDAHRDGRRQRRLLLRQRERSPRRRYGNADKMNFETPLTLLVWLTSIVSVVVTFVVSLPAHPATLGDGTLWWKLSTIITCGTLAGAIIPELVKVFTSTESAPRAARSSPRRAKAARRSTSSPASSPATSAPTGWASSSSS